MWCSIIKSDMCLTTAIYLSGKLAYHSGPSGTF
jgi:hypothetical protein